MAVLLGFGYFDVILILVSIVLLLLWTRSRRPVEYPPGPTPFPVIGNFHNLANGDIIEVFRNLRKKYGDIFSLSLGSFWVIVVNGADNLRELLVKRAEYTSDRPPLYVFKLTQNKGVVSSSGPPWKFHRTLVLSKLREFGFGKRSFEPSIMEEATMFLELIESYKGQPFDISSIINTSMSNIVMSITVGRRFEYDDPVFKSIVKELNESVNDPAFSGPVNFMPALALLPGDLFGGKRAKQRADRLFDYFRKEIQEHEKTLNEDNIRDFIDMYLIEMKQQQSSKDSVYTEDQLLAVITEFFGAGTETTATTIKWTILYLLNNMEVQNKMRKEIDDVVGNGRLPSLSDKPNLPYCEAVILESLRLGNIVPFSLPHNVLEEIDFNGFKIPKNSVIFPVLDSVAHDEKNFPHSEEFKPERFLDAEGRVCGQEKVLTFSLGRRVCLGESLARMELFLYLTSMVQRFEFRSPEGEDAPPIKGVLGITYSPALYKFRAVSRC